VQSIQSLKSRRDAEEGFTLIELMVVVLIIAILIAIAIPTFLGARQRAQDRSAQSDLRNALTAEKTSYTDTQKYTTTAATLQAIEPSLRWTSATPPVTVSVGDAVTAGDSDVVCLQETSKSGTVWSLADIAIGTNAGAYYAQGTCTTTVATLTGGAPWKTPGW
jgi:type IV pilus assembly protein PilA